MKHKYRIITDLTVFGNEMFISQHRPFWWPFWFDIEFHSSKESAEREIELQKKKESYKRRVINLG